jgi:hypothetical protein
MMYTWGYCLLLVHSREINPLSAKLNPICNLLELLGAHPLFQVSRIRVKQIVQPEKK